MKGRRVTAVTTASDCATRAVVEPMIYGDSSPADRPKAPGPSYAGKVRAHPDLDLLYENEDALWMAADLAVIFLTEDVKGIAPVKLAGAEVKERDRIALVGYGANDRKRPPAAPVWREPCFGDASAGGRQHPIPRRAERLEGGGAASQLDQGDSGGGCFRVDDRTVLVGVNTAKAADARHEKISVFTSVYPFKDWLRLQRQCAHGPST